MTRLRLASRRIRQPLETMLFGCLLLLGVTAACQPGSGESGEASEVSSREIRADVLQWFEDFQAALDRGDSAEIASFYAADSRFRWFEDGHLRYRTPDEIEAALDRVVAAGPVQTRYDDVEVLVTSSDSATLHARFETTLGDDAEPMVRFSGVVTATLLRTLPIGTEGVGAEPVWAFLVGHSSTERAGNEADGREEEP